MDHGLISKHLSGPVGAIVHFGAGNCTELDVYKRTDAEKVILVEAVPEQAAALRRRIAGMNEAEVIQVAVSGSNGQVALKILNLIEASSLRTPTGLIDLFPGISVTREITVDGQLPQDILARQSLDSNKKNCLVIDIPGEEMVALKELEASGYLELFETIVLRCGMSSLYEGAEPAETLLEFLTSQGYEVTEVDEHHDPDRPQWILKKDVVKLENIELREQVACLTKKHDEQVQLTEHGQKELEKLKGERDEQAKLAEQRQQELEKLKGEQEQQAAVAEEKEAEIQSTKSDLSIALRLQTLRESDLKDLQVRYSELLEVKKRQDELLDKLQQRLGVAAECLRQLNMQGNEEIEGNLAQDLVRALSGDT